MTKTYDLKTAAIKVLTRKGYEIVADEPEAPLGEGVADNAIVAKHEGELVFVLVEGCVDDGEGFKDLCLARAEVEKVAIRFLMKNGPELRESPVRFDLLEILDLKNDNGFVKHTVNVLA